MGEDKRGFVFKICVVGDGAVGKTSLIQRYTEGEFNEEYIMTLGAQFTKHETEFEGVKTGWRQYRIPLVSPAAEVESPDWERIENLLKSTVEPINGRLDKLQCTEHLHYYHP